MILNSFYVLFENNIVSVCERASFKLGHVYELRVNGSLADFSIYDDLISKGNSLFAVIANINDSKSSVQLNIETSNSWFKRTLFTLLIEGSKVDLIESSEAIIKMKTQNYGYIYETYVNPPTVFEIKDIRAQLMKNENKKQAGWGKRIAFFLVSLFAFVVALIMVLGYDLIFSRFAFSISVFISGLFIHELGHFLTMKYFGYKNLKMFFIPFFGAAVYGKKTTAPRHHEAISLLMGPVPGLILASVLIGIEKLVSSPALLSTQTAAEILLFLNGFNLLPIKPLDGGKFLDVVLFSRNRFIETGFTLISSVLLMLLGLTQIFLGGWSIGAFMLIGFGAIPALFIRQNFKFAYIASKIKLDGISGTTCVKELSDNDLSQILEKSKPLFANRTALEECVMTIENIIERSMPPLNIGATIIFLIIYLLSWVVTIAAMARVFS